VSSDVVCGDLRSPQTTSLGTLPEDVNVLPKNVGGTIHN
jgi:hypothetical protein